MSVGLPTYCKWIITDREILIISAWIISGLMFVQKGFLSGIFRVQWWGLVKFLTRIISTRNVAFEIFITYIQEYLMAKLS